MRPPAGLSLSGHSPAQLAPRPQATMVNLLFDVQQPTVIASRDKEKEVSKKPWFGVRGSRPSISLVLVVVDELFNSSKICQIALILRYLLNKTYCAKFHCNCAKFHLNCAIFH